jgi:hypothetical protein
LATLDFTKGSASILNELHASGLGTPARTSCCYCSTAHIRHRQATSFIHVPLPRLIENMASKMMIHHDFSEGDISAKPNNSGNLLSGGF